jgi:hypothetical protein
MNKYLFMTTVMATIMVWVSASHMFQEVGLLAIIGLFSGSFFLGVLGVCLFGESRE